MSPTAGCAIGSGSRRNVDRARPAGFARRISLFIEAFLVIRQDYIDIGASA
jgi:hypothetical protein